MRLSRLVDEKGELDVGVVLDREGEKGKVFRGQLVAGISEDDEKEGEVKTVLRWKEEDEVMLIIIRVLKWIRKCMGRE